MRKRILLMVPMLHQGGFEKVCIRTARLLREYCDVTILIFDDSDIAYDITGLEVINIQVGSKKHLIDKIANIFRRIRAVNHYKRDLNIDYTYSFGITANLINILSRRRGKIWIGIRGFTDLKSVTYPILCRYADRIICCSQEILNIIHTDYPNKNVHCIYNPYNIDEIILASSEDISDETSALFLNNQVIVSMGRDDVVKGFWHLIKCFNFVHKEITQTKLLIIGDGDYSRDKELVKKLGIEDSVIFTGVLTNPFPTLKRATAYALTSLNEGFPNALVEAMALGLPVVATNCQTGPAEILSGKTTLEIGEGKNKPIEAEYGILTDRLSSVIDINQTNLDAQESILAQALYDILTNIELREKYSKKSQERASFFSDEKYTTLLLGLME